jgi:hypothetical protein
VLHTWGQNLLHHPHIHFLVPGGGISPDGESWIACRPGFFLPVTVLSRMFRRLFLHYLQKAFAAGELNFFSAHRHLHEAAAFKHHLAPAWNTEWVVYAKQPFAGPAQVLDYVGRYTHRVAISNNRLLSLDNGKVQFRWKDYRDGNRQLINNEFAFIPKFHDMLANAGRDRSSCPITICLYPEELDAFAPDQVGALARYEELGVTRCIVGLNVEKREGILPVLDRWAGFMRELGTGAVAN